MKIYFDNSDFVMLRQGRGYRMFREVYNFERVIDLIVNKVVWKCILIKF